MKGQNVLVTHAIHLVLREETGTEDFCYPTIKLAALRTLGMLFPLRVVAAHWVS